MGFFHFNIGKECDVKLNMKNAQRNKDDLYCGQHVPKPKLTNVADALSTQHVANAPKKVTEGLHKTQVGTGNAATIGMDAMSNQHAINVPKKSNEGLTKTFVASSEAVSKGGNPSSLTGHKNASPPPSNPKEEEEENAEEEEEKEEDV